jgi:hypothetical protein
LWKLISLAVGLWFLALIVITSSTLIGVQQPHSWSIEFFHLDSCKPPCWLGIVPGKTSLDEAKAIVEQAYGNSSDYSLTIISEPNIVAAKVREQGTDTELVWIRIVTTRRAVSSISLQFSEESREDIVLTMGDIHSLFGTPQFFGFRNSYSPVVYGCTQGAAVFSISGNYPQPNEPLMSLEFYDDKNSGGSDWLLNAIPWQGFITNEKLHQYMNRYGVGAGRLC